MLLRDLSQIFVFLILTPFGISAQPVTDTSFWPEVGPPTFERGKGPAIMVDEGHYNFRAMSPTQVPHRDEIMPGRLMPFANMLRRDGFQVFPVSGLFTNKVFAKGDILVIADALAKENVNSWELPFYPAFTMDEINAVESWVREGGSLLLVAGTYGGAASMSEMAERFGLFFSWGSAYKLEDQNNPINRGWIVFRRSDGSLAHHAITNATNTVKRIDSVMTFEGQAFRARPGADVTPLLVFKKPTMLVLASNDPHELRPRIRADGMLQGAVLKYGKGRVAVFGESGMFCSQVVNQSGEPIGMNHPEASQNGQFILNVMHWLSAHLSE